MCVHYIQLSLEKKANLISRGGGASECPSPPNEALIIYANFNKLHVTRQFFRQSKRRLMRGCDQQMYQIKATFDAVLYIYIYVMLNCIYYSMAHVFHMHTCIVYKRYPTDVCLCFILQEHDLDEQIRKQNSSIPLLQ